jgi:hypothetical protein
MTSYSGDSLLVVDGGSTGSVEFATADDAQTLRTILEGRAGQPLSITLAPAYSDADVEGHAESPSVALTLRLGDDDVEGHAISVHFPTSADAARFRRNLLLTGAVAGSLILGSAGAVVINSQANAPADDAIRGPVYERPVGRGALEYSDPTMSISEAAAAAAAAEAAAAVTPMAIDPATGKPADRGFLAGVEGPAIGGADSATNRPEGKGPLEGVD